MSGLKILLEQYKKLQLSKETLLKELQTRKDEKVLNDQVVQIYARDVINILKQYQQKNVSQQQLIDWVNMIWFSDFYEYADEESDSIASVMDKLEELDETETSLSDSQINIFINALKNNEEIE
jgi:hypothetical protein